MKIPYSSRRGRSDVAGLCLPIWPAPWTGMVVLGCTPALLQAHTATDEPLAASERLEIIGLGEKHIGRTVAASNGAVAGLDLSIRPLLRTAEMLEAVPGLMALRAPSSARRAGTFCAASNSTKVPTSACSSMRYR